MKNSFRLRAVISVCTAATSLALLSAARPTYGQAAATTTVHIPPDTAPSPDTPATHTLVQRGAYLARAGDCAACHTAPGGKPFAGGLPMETPFGTIYSTNITPDKDTGIGGYSFQAFDDAVRRGTSKRNGHLYPAMPYPSFRILSHDDMDALYAYFMNGIEPVNQPDRPNQLPFPLNVRALMIGWNLLYLKADTPYRDDPSKSVEWNRGAYLVQGLGHCGACHTPHGATGQEKAFSEQDGKRYLSGATLAGWNAPTLADGLGTGLAGWSTAELVAFLKTGRGAHTAAFGAMTEVVNDSTQHLSDADLKAIAVYLKSLTPEDTALGPPISANDAASATRALRAGDLHARGAAIYLDNCNACHRSDGTGAGQTFPSLSGNPVVNAIDPTSLIHIVLTGSTMPSSSAMPAPLAMPDFGWRLSNQQVADVLTFVRGSWGNQAEPVDASAVKRLRAALHAQAPQRDAPRGP
ncbi:Gluconate 2-dehydrogenase cytochrome c subunit [Paraburkholderia domus]|uniref:Gluconate 2-dehydrogenase cytochrome c subunit n=1 Tax=Paraburkholderia domus TaxID=2793075 RepID=A0A9N8QWH6_9BURK|nr:cytochrome c [Paraburkholderia domus]MBK5063614.1 cytochrome c [Burkholderia sp. R-70199]MBK5089635.1 cytochrome c [Burkholderia sp. R-69927]MBK5122900.1 cytochrome c [Burkholderia sp. R-69980]MBK5165232.1 cytochrome c [Burkholderia sp. R-70211]MBK5182688.1 cytochrome c [Burkholderia sp. R-69749]MCI0148942.1 c-type cytochrome [Paraburkholderia sediminicola]